MKKIILLFLLISLAFVSTAFADDGVYYQIFVGSFYDSNGDKRGDLDGITHKVQYIKDLGVKGLWITPVHPSPSYHKYDVLDYYQVDEVFGGLEAFDRLVTALSKENIGLIIDLVINHSSNLHTWFLSAAKSLDIEPCGKEKCAYEELCREHNPYVRYYNFTRGEGQHRVEGTSDWYYEGHFGPHMPDFNLDDETLKKEIKNIAYFWLDRGVKGFRLDAVAHYYDGNRAKNTEFLSWFNSIVKEHKKDAYIVAEAWTDESVIFDLWKSGIDSFFNFGFQGTEGQIVKYMRSKKGNAFADRLESYTKAREEAFENSIDAPFLGNHDTARISGVLMQRENRLKQAASIYLTMPGNPFIYYGEEIGMTGSGRDENKRMPFVWGEDEGMCEPYEYTDQDQLVKASMVEQENDGNSLLNFYKDFIKFRNENIVFSKGRLSAVDLENSSVCAYYLEYAGEKLLIIHNMGDKQTEVKLSKNLNLAYAFETGSGKAEITEDRLSLPPYTGCILK